MTPAAVRAAVLESIYAIAPEAEDDDLPSNVSIRKELDLDSMDFLNVVTEVHTRLGVEVPEADYGQIQTLDGFVSYVSSRLA